jgi:hypothetical protein
MKFSAKTGKIISIFFTAIALTACGGAPSEGDIKAAIEKQMQNETAAMQAFGGKKSAEMLKGLMPEIKNIKKIGCKEDGEKAYKCDVEMEVTQMGATNKGIRPLRFVKGSDGWVAQQ